LGVNTLIVEQIADQVTRVTLNRPQNLNALTHEMVGELHQTFDGIARDRQCRVVILTGAGRGFCAGLDLKDSGEPPGAEELGEVARRFTGQQHIASLVTRMRTLRQPIIAAVNGPAAGGGMAISLAADIRLGTPTTRFGVAFIRIGLSGCDIGVSYLLPRLIGASRAFELMLTGRFVDADEAERIGLVSRVVPATDLLDTAADLAESIVAHSAFGVWMTKEVMWSNLEAASLASAIDLENRTQILATFTGDMQRAAEDFQRRPSHRVK
jgi:enoyl-CoA hydratase